MLDSLFTHNAGASVALLGGHSDTDSQGQTERETGDVELQRHLDVEAARRKGDRGKECGNKDARQTELMSHAKPIFSKFIARDDDFDKSKVRGGVSGGVSKADPDDLQRLRNSKGLLTSSSKKEKAESRTGKPDSIRLPGYDDHLS